MAYSVYNPEPMTITEELLLNTIFLKVTTVPLVGNLRKLPDAVRDGVLQRISYNQSSYQAEVLQQTLRDEGQVALLAEVSRLTSVTVGGLKLNEQGQFITQLHTYAERDEADLLGRVGNFLTKSLLNRPNVQLAGYQVRTHDVPFLMKRFLTYQAPLPNLLRLHGRKPWDPGLFDLSDYWSNGDIRQSVSLALMAQALHGEAAKNLPADSAGDSRYYWQTTEGPFTPETAMLLAGGVRVELDVTMQLAVRLRGLS